MRIISYALIISLLLQGFALSPAMAEGDDICQTDTFTPDAISPTAINDKCGGGVYAACVSTRKALVEWSKQYKDIAEQACKKRRESIGEINDLNQSSSHGEVASRADAGIKDIKALIAANEKILATIPKATDQNLAALTKLANQPASPPKFRNSVSNINSGFSRAKHRPELFEKKIFTGSEISGLGNTPVAQESKAEIDTLVQSQEFARALLRDKEENEKAVQQLSQAKSDALQQQKNTQTAEGPAEKESGSGFNPMSLLPFAAPLAGLLMQQKAQDSGLSDSSLPDPDLATLPEKVPGTSFENKNSSQTPPSTGLGENKGPDTGMQMPVETYAGGSEYVEPFSGDISQGDAESSNIPLTAGAGFSSSSDGASSSSGSSTTGGAKADRKPASSAPKGEEETVIASGGGGGMGYAGAGPVEGETESDSGMKDMLQDMEATLEDAPTGLFAEAEKANSGDEIGAQDGDSLFPRVRACHVRNLKKGFVLNGLGEKLPESDSD